MQHTANSLAAVEELSQEFDALAEEMFTDRGAAVDEIGDALLVAWLNVKDIQYDYDESEIVAALRRAADHITKSTSN